jgi:hypothetical protein
MAFHDAGKILAQPVLPQKVRPELGMADIMGPAPADIMEHCTLPHEMKNDIGVACCVLAGTIPHRPAVGNDFCAAPGIAQQILAGFSLCIRHGPAIS